MELSRVGMNIVRVTGVLAILVLAGCTTVAERFTGEELRKNGGRLEEGMRATVLTLEGTRFRMDVLEVTPTDLVGRGTAGRRLTIPLADIERVEVREFSPAKAVLWTLVGAALIYSEVRDQQEGSAGQ